MTRGLAINDFIIILVSISFEIQITSMFFSSNTIVTQENVE
jgi:hypothetical protein